MLKNIFLLMTIATLPIIMAIITLILDRKTRFGKSKNVIRHVVIGILFGIISIISSENGVEIYGAIMNVRDASPLIAGLAFGGPAGIIAGAMGGIWRWLAVYWGAGTYTRLACSISTVIAGLFGAWLKKNMFKNKIPSWFYGMAIGTVMEVFHMLMIFLTNMNDVNQAFLFVESCTIPMVVANSMAVSISMLIAKLFEKDRDTKSESKKHLITNIYQINLFSLVLIAYLLTSSFTYWIQYQISDDPITRNITIYVNSFMEILVFAGLFILVYFLTKKLVVDNIYSVNNSLSKITEGNLNEKVKNFSSQEFSNLSDGINDTVDTLKEYIDAEARRLDDELKLAKSIQHSALPNIFPPYPNRNDFEIWAAMNTAKEVGGDFYDLYMLDENRLAFLIADVSGKGIPAAMFMMKSKMIIKGLAESGKNIEEVFNEANDILCQNNEAEMFVTAWMGILDLKSGKLSFVNAGHNPPLISSNNSEFEFIKNRSGVFLGSFEGAKYKSFEMQLSPNDKLYLYTDGVTEAINTGKEMFGEERLKETLNRLSDYNTKEVCEAVNTDVTTFTDGESQFDDITMLAIKYNG